MANMYDHDSAVYKNNCLTAAKKIAQPVQIDQKFLHELHNEVTSKLNRKLKANLQETTSVGDMKTFLDFVESIPEYQDINHLSNKEFYRKLDTLKEKQREFCEYLNRKIQLETKTSWVEDYKTRDLNRGENPHKTRLRDEESASLSDKDLALLKPPSRRSVRIPILKSSPEPDPTEKSPLESFSNTPLPFETKSAPNTPLRTRKNVDGITIPRPFQMTVRDEENKIVDELFLQVQKPSKQDKAQMFRAHEAQMRPFSFTRRDEEMQELTRKFSKSLPCVYNDELPVKAKKFKAKPIPRNLFSNYIYKKMHEDEFYRALQKKIRAEEMLKHASLPPSMAKREKSRPKIDVCPRSYRDLETPDNSTQSTRKTRKVPNFKAYHDKYERELEELKNEFISTSPRPFKLKSTKKGRKGYSRISSASNSDTRTASSWDMSSINRSNLAAVLRIQSAKKRMEMEMTRRLEEAKLKEEARWREKLLRKKPVWQTLAYSHEEDLSVRLQLRRDEERLRNEEHRLRMELMLGRVNQQPTLFERQSQIKFPKTKEEIIEQLHCEHKIRKAESSQRSSEELEETVEANASSGKSEVEDGGQYLCAST
ncbi:hypothetical protein HUJ04_013496 [Dendroctonus ponderosae]|nr:hypothetical protein HUJ04_013496 [Dendroctonus ponderosae]KAH1001262.1 hypothetical protein HUJ04_013496 [Dendroctonus ponderosae]